MIIEQCPHCQVMHVQAAEQFTARSHPSYTTTWTVVRCQNSKCLQLSLVDSASGAQQVVYPLGKYELDPDLPISAEAREDFREAGQCLVARCYKASMVMSRRSLQRCLKEQGCTQKLLVDQLNYAMAHDLLRKAFHPLAEEVRQYGNLSAHPDDEQLCNVSRDAAQHILDFTALIIHEFYEVPASAAKLKAGRTSLSSP